MIALIRLSKFIDSLNTKLGSSVRVLTVVLVLLQFLVVVLRYIFGYNSTIMQESIVWLYATMVFLAASWGYVLDQHVRVDVFYQGFSTAKKALTNLFCNLFILIPLTIVLWIYTYPYVVSSWIQLEGSVEADGIQAVFLLKTLMLFFIGQLFLQAISESIKNWEVYLTQKSNSD